MPAIIVSLLFILAMVSLAFPPLLLITGPLFIVLVSDARRSKRHQRYHAQRLSESEMAMVIAKGVR